MGTHGAEAATASSAAAATAAATAAAASAAAAAGAVGRKPRLQRGAGADNPRDAALGLGQSPDARRAGPGGPGVKDTVSPPVPTNAQRRAALSAIYGGRE
jgi:hypothetical protein